MSADANRQKQEYLQTIREWISLDKEILLTKRALKEKTVRHKELMTRIVGQMKINEVDTYAIGGGALIRKQRKSKKAISKKYLIAELQTYFAETPEEGQRVAQFILDNRDESVSELLERKLP